MPPDTAIDNPAYTDRCLGVFGRQSLGLACFKRVHLLQMMAFNLIAKRLLSARQFIVKMMSYEKLFPSYVQCIPCPAPGFLDVKPAIPGRNLNLLEWSNLKHVLEYSTTASTNKSHEYSIRTSIHNRPQASAYSTRNVPQKRTPYLFCGKRVLTTAPQWPTKGERVL